MEILLNIVSDLGTYISLIIAMLSLIISLVVSVSSQSKNDYVEIDNQYKDLLSMGLKNPKLRDPIVTCNYKKLEKENRDLYFQYCSYAHMIWNFLETLYDFGSKKKKSNMKTIWDPVMLEENKLHYSWFLKNRRLFRKEFQDYVINYVNELEITEGTMKNFKEVYSYMEQEFPLEELKDKNQILKLLLYGKYKLYLLRYKHRIEGDNNIIGYAMVYSNKKNQMLFLDYLNILKSYQNCGYGSKFITLLKKQLNKNGKGIILEIEPSDNMDETKLRRKVFYIRNGGCNLECNYLLPYENGSIPMELMFIPCDNVMFVAKEEIRDFVKEAVSSIHSDFTHTLEVINSYINDIPDYKQSINHKLHFVKGNYKDIEKVLEIMDINYNKQFHMSKEQLESLLRTNKYVFYIARDVFENIIGCAIVYELKSNDFVFLDYLVVSKFYQLQGYGKAMIELLKSKYSHMKYGMLCETPYPSNNQTDYYAIFVEKTGGFILDSKYVYPSNENNVPVRLTIYPKNGVTEIDKSIIQMSVNEAISFIHSDIENIEKIIETNIRNIKSFNNPNK